MPVAITSGTTRVPLTKLEGAFVVLRKLKWGEALEREKMSLTAQTTLGKGKAEKVEYVMDPQLTRKYDFQHCIVDHNLTDETERPLDFRSGMDFDTLDADIAQEIADLIDDLNSGKELEIPFESGQNGESSDSK